MLVFQDATKTYPRSATPALSGVNFVVPQGSIVGLVGLNGAGKSTLIRLATGLALPSRGTVIVDGLDIVHQKAAASARIGWVPELPVFQPKDTLRTTMDYLGRYHGRGGGDSAKHLDLLRWVGLGEVAGSPFSTLSQGMKKRFAIAVAMMANPPNLILDEVLNGLDPEWIKMARDWMLLMRQQGRSVLLSSHLLSELQGLADHFAFIHQGRLLGVWPRAAISASLPPRYFVRAANMDQAGVDLLAPYGFLTVQPPWVIIDQPRAAPEVITGILTERRYAIQEFRVEERGLEEFFLRLVGNRGAG